MARKEIKRRRTKRSINYDNYVVVISRSNKNIAAQVLEPNSKKTVFSISSNKLNKVSKTEKSEKIGQEVAKFLKGKKIEKAVFDRNGYLYHGRVKAVAEAIRKDKIII
jgi:large subunit ribosomal protein L18